MKIEVAIPCYNEEQTVAKVAMDFKTALPDADIVVYDNDSDDATAEVARKAGARVVRVNRRGKGYVVQTIFESSPADLLVMVDGDDTYEAADVLALIAPIIDNQADMTIGTRLHTTESEFRRMHHLGNRALTLVMNTMFGTVHTDILSGYRVFSRQFRQSVPLISTGFEIETELMIQALSNGMMVKEVPIRFRQRPPGSTSKLSSFKDGYRILLTMAVLLRDHRPLFTFSLAGSAFFIVGASVWLYAVLSNRTVGAFSLQAAGVVFMELAAGFVLVGFILSTINTRMRELWSLLRRRS